MKHLTKRAKQSHKDEIKYCEHCSELMTRKRDRSGKLESNLHFGRRKYCDVECMKRRFTLKVDRGSSERTSRHSARLRMGYFIGYDECRGCGRSVNLDVHHIDGDPFNNELINLTLLCRSCHIKEHRGGRKCLICDNKHKGLGYCDKHYQRFKKYGDPLMTKHGIRR